MTNCSSSADIVMTRGNNHPPLMWQFLVEENPDVLFDLAGSVLKLRLIWPGASIARSSDSDADLVIDYPNSTLAWFYTSAVSRSLPLGRLTQYEIERWIADTQRTLVRGSISAVQGNNPD